MMDKINNWLKAKSKDSRFSSLKGSPVVWIIVFFTVKGTIVTALALVAMFYVL